MKAQTFIFKADAKKDLRQAKTFFKVALAITTATAGGFTFYIGNKDLFLPLFFGFSVFFAIMFLFWFFAVGKILGTVRIDPRSDLLEILCFTILNKRKTLVFKLSEIRYSVGHNHKLKSYSFHFIKGGNRVYTTEAYDRNKEDAMKLHQLRVYLDEIGMKDDVLLRYGRPSLNIEEKVKESEDLQNLIKEELKKIREQAKIDRINKRK